MAFAYGLGFIFGLRGKTSQCISETQFRTESFSPAVFISWLVDGLWDIILGMGQGHIKEEPN